MIQGFSQNSARKRAISSQSLAHEVKPQYGYMYSTELIDEMIHSLNAVKWTSTLDLIIGSILVSNYGPTMRIMMRTEVTTEELPTFPPIRYGE